MAPGYYGLKIYRGDTTRWRFVLWQDDAKTIAVDLASVMVSAQLRDRPDGAVCATLACTVSLPNTIDAVLSAANSAKVVNGVWDLQLVYSSGDVVTALSGTVLATPDITY